MWFTKHAHWPCTLTPVTLLPLRLSPPRPDHAAPVTTVLTVPSGYNYSAFLPLSILSLSLSLPAWLGLDTEVQAEGRRAAALCSQCAERHSLHCGSEQVGGGNVKGGRGGVTHWMPRPLGWRGGGGGGPAAQQPMYLLLPFSLSITRFLSRFLSLFQSLG